MSFSRESQIGMKSQMNASGSGAPDGSQDDLPGSVPAHAVPAHAGDVAVLHEVLIVADRALKHPLPRPQTFWRPRALKQCNIRSAAVVLRALNEVDGGLHRTQVLLFKCPYICLLAFFAH